MGWGIKLNTDIYYSKVDFKSKEDVQKRIDTIEESINSIKTRLTKYVFMTEPHKFIPEEYKDDVIGFLNEEVEDLLSTMEELIWEQTRLYILVESWDAAHHPETKKAMVPHNPNELNRTWMSGDYIQSCTPDGKDIPEDYWDRYKYNVVE
jgi:hypothetical protein